MPVLAAKQIEKEAKFFDYGPRAAALELFKLRDREVILAGPAGTGKSRACLEKLYALAERYPRSRLAMVRKTRRSLTQSGMVTFEQRVLPHPLYIPFHTSDQEYRFPNGSILAVGGLDDPQKLYSSDWDVIFAQQAEELSEDDWQSMLRGLRNWRLPYQQLIGDCNPSAPTHWIRSRAQAGHLKLLSTTHEMNPELYSEDSQDWTDRGRQYLAILDGYTGVLHKRLRLGLWVAAEGMVYEGCWDRAVHVIPRFEIPKDWPRYWSIDFGFTNPFAWAAYAEDPDGRLYLYKEIYYTKKTVAEHAKRILEVTKDEPKPKVIVCDHDAEDRATFSRETGLQTKPAWKAVSAGIQAVTERLKIAGDGKPRFFYLENSVADIDPELLQRHEPTCGDAEVEVYAWKRDATGLINKEEPEKRYDHGMDRDRYLITHVDQTWRRTLPMKTTVPILTRSGEQQDTELVQPSKWRFR